MPNETNIADKLGGGLDQPFGHVARVGYAAVAYVAEVMPAAFYRMAPSGVSLALLTIQREGGSDGNVAELDQIFDEVIAAGRSLAKAGVDVVVLGGRPVILRRGMAGAEALMKELSAEFGVPVLSDATAQARAYRALGSKRIATAHPFLNEENARHEGQIRDMGFEPAGALGYGSTRIALSSLAPRTALDLARRLLKEHPEADTLLFPCPHWYVVDAIQPIEDEFGVDVVSNFQAMLWDALSTLGLRQPITGFGRLLREFPAPV